MEQGENKTKAQIIGGAISGLLMLVCIVVYLIIGAVTNIWHPTWIIIVAAAIITGIIGIITNTMSDLKKVNNEQTDAE